MHPTTSPARGKGDCLDSMVFQQTFPKGLYGGRRKDQEVPGRRLRDLVSARTAPD